MAARIPLIDAERCSGCGRCIAACQPGLFAFELQGWRKISVLQDAERCNGCAQCARVCAIQIITMAHRAKATVGSGSQARGGKSDQSAQGSGVVGTVDGTVSDGLDAPRSGHRVNHGAQNKMKAPVHLVLR